MHKCINNNYYWLFRGFVAPLTDNISFLIKNNIINITNNGNKLVTLDANFNIDGLPI